MLLAELEELHHLQALPEPQLSAHEANRLMTLLRSARAWSGA
jgi:hypothetical protein